MNPFRKYYSVRGLTAFVFGLLLFTGMSSVYAQVTSGILSDITNSYKTASAGWTTVMLGYANRLFWMLAAIEFAWSGITWALEKDSMNAWTAALIKKIMSIGFFYAILLNANTWVPAIIDSLRQAGQTAGGSGGGLAPSDIVDTGIATASQMLTGIKDMSLWDDFGTIIIAGLAAIAIVIAFVIIAAQLMVALIESYIVVSAGMLFLGFGGSRWTTDFTQKFISYAMATGVKLMMLYLIVGLGINQADTWAGMLASASKDGYVNNVFAVLGGSLVLCYLAFQIPGMAASMLSGAPTLTAGGLGATAAAVAGGVLAAGGAVASPALREARGAMQAVTSGYGAARAGGGGVLGSAVSGLGSAGAQMGKEAGRSLGSALGLAAPSSSTSSTIGGRAADALDAKKASSTGGAQGAKAGAGANAVPPPGGGAKGNAGGAGAGAAGAAGGSGTAGSSGSSGKAGASGTAGAGTAGTPGAAGTSGGASSSGGTASGSTSAASTGASTAGAAGGKAPSSAGADSATAGYLKSAGATGQGSSAPTAASASAGATGQGTSAAGFAPTSSQSPSSSMDGSNQAGSGSSGGSATNAVAPPVSSSVNTQGQDSDAAEATRMSGQAGYTGPDGQYQPTGVYDAPSTLESEMNTPGAQDKLTQDMLTPGEQSATAPPKTASKDMKPANYDKLKRPMPSDQAGGNGVNIRMGHTDD